MATRFQNVVSGVITGVFVKKALDSSTAQDYDLICDGIYMSNLEQACKPSLLIKHKITHVLSVCQAKNAFENGLDAAFASIDLNENQKYQLEKWKEEWKDIVYERIGIADKPKVNISSRFAKANAFINNVLADSNNIILLHCQAGISRSATICLAYLMSKGKTLDHAYLLVKSKRGCIRPNNGFAIALLRYQEELYPGVDSPKFKKELGLEKILL